MAEVNLRIGPAGEGWWLYCDLPLAPVYYHSGARAEDAARGLAVRFRDAGRDVRLTINDRSERPVATHRYLAGR